MVEKKATKAAEAKPEAADEVTKALKALEAAFRKAERAGIAVKGTYAYEDKDGSTNNGNV
jgi:uncharacterized protein YggE